MGQNVLVEEGQEQAHVVAFLPRDDILADKTLAVRIELVGAEPQQRAYVANAARLHLAMS